MSIESIESDNENNPHILFTPREVLLPHTAYSEKNEPEFTNKGFSFDEQELGCNYNALNLG